jgi:CHAT domain-containing protein
MSRLPFIAAEVDAICTAAIGAGAALSDVITSPASVAAVIASLPDANIVHFACHGLPHLSNALGSGFCLHDGMLSIARIMQLQLKDAFLAFMCACETTKGDSEARSQTVHLGAAMLFAGYKSVIGTIWYGYLSPWPPTF